MNQPAQIIGYRGRCSVTVWREVEDALEAIIEDYERVNRIISFFQDDRARQRGLEKVGVQTGVSLELGSGPRNFTQWLHSFVDGFLVCLDFSDKMLSVTRSRNNKQNVSFVWGVFEALPFREGVISFVAAAYALRDSTDKERTLEEIRYILQIEGRFLVVDIGKPNNPLLRSFLSLYMRFIVPILGGLVTGYGYKNPWSILYKTYVLLPSNKKLLDMMSQTLGHSELDELAMGGLIVAMAEKT
jgi:demethylmenaquinone methyltransferase/2-methoxy-6-polyprenyl-1,4-benzoquinol methylase